MRKLNAEDLEKYEPCPKGIAWFIKKFPNGMEISLENVKYIRRYKYPFLMWYLSTRGLRYDFEDRIYLAYFRNPEDNDMDVKELVKEMNKKGVIL